MRNLLAGELHNSTTSSLDFVKAEWAQLAAMNLNTVLAPVYWELLEPKEGQFDFALVDGRWVPGRRLNGDENGQGEYVRLNSGTLPNGGIQRVKLYRYR